jgi:hypothetical protein
VEIPLERRLKSPPAPQRKPERLSTTAGAIAAHRLEIFSKFRYAPSKKMILPIFPYRNEDRAISLSKRD